MCFRSPPPPPPLPDPEPVAPPPEKTADQVVTGTQRQDIAKKGTKAASTTAKAVKRRGTASLRIPLLEQQTESGNLRTPL